MSEFIQQRHPPSAPLDRPRELIVACAPMRSNVNLSRIVRAAGCCGVQRMICCGNAKVIGKIARDTEEVVQIETHRTLPPVLKRLREEGSVLVGLEQTSGAQSLFEFPFPRKAVLVVGNERLGIEPEVLRMRTTPWKSRSTAGRTPTTPPPPPPWPCTSIAGSIHVDKALGERRSGSA
jgi:tRNA G18 (ribose-2'-O)-methylase SpoU